MYKFSYEDVLEDLPQEARDRERRALDYSIELLKAAEESGVNSVEAAKALAFANKLWTILIEDLASPENDLPKELRAQIISIGIWILKEAERIRSGEVHSFSGIVSVSEAICEGLK